MRKVVKRPDGSEEAIEGTPEEVREYERIVENDRAPKQKKAVPDVIKGKESGNEDLIKRLSDEFRRIADRAARRRERDDSNAPWIPNYPSPIWIAPACSQCYSNPCACGWLRWDPTKIYCGPGVAVKSVTVTSADTKPIGRLG